MYKAVFGNTFDGVGDGVGVGLGEDTVMYIDHSADVNVGLAGNLLGEGAE